MSNLSLILQSTECFATDAAAVFTELAARLYLDGRLVANGPGLSRQVQEASSLGTI